VSLFKQYTEVSKVCNTFCIEKGYGRRRTQYALCDSFIGCSQPVTNTGQGDGAGCTLGFSVTWIGAFGVTICMRISCAIKGFTFLQETYHQKHFAFLCTLPVLFQFKNSLNNVNRVPKFNKTWKWVLSRTHKTVPPSAQISNSYNFM
jgi:hypothetical protein